MDLSWSTEMREALQQSFSADRSVAQARKNINAQFDINLSWGAVNSMARRLGYLKTLPYAPHPIEQEPSQ